MQGVFIKNVILTSIQQFDRTQIIFGFECDASSRESTTCQQPQRIFILYQYRVYNRA